MVLASAPSVVRTTAGAANRVIGEAQGRPASFAVMLIDLCFDKPPTRCAGDLEKISGGDVMLESVGFFLEKKREK